MVVTTEDAFAVLELPCGADLESVQTSYKKLALKWHPDKHKNSSESIKKFKEINLAFMRITDPEFKNDKDITMETMYQLFREVFFSKTTEPAAIYDVSSEDELSSEEDVMIPPPQGKPLTPEEIAKNAEDLISEEEKEKKRAEKRRAKKKRRREKKKLEKLAENSDDKNTKQSNNVSKTKEQRLPDGHDSSDPEDTNFDANAAFFTKVNKKTKTKGSEIMVTANKKPDKKDKQQKTAAEPSEQVEDLDPIVIKSRQLAVNGNKLANQGLYQDAIMQFSEAISLDPSDFRFFGNRSYCYDRVGQFEKALKDADRAIFLSSEWPKGYFRKGRALAGLKLYADAEHSFMQVLKLDRNCEDAMQELLRVRTHQITEMGFSQAQAEASIKQHGSVQQALDSLLAGVVAESSLNEVYMSDDEEDFQKITNFHPAPISVKDQKMDPCNPDGLTALWVGNVLPEVKEKTLMQLFSKYGTVTSVRTLPEKFCAFVNFKTTDGAGKAMKNLQGVECGGQRLLIKFPDNPVTNGHSSGNAGSYVVKKNTNKSSVPQLTKLQQQQLQQQLKMSGPVNGDECYFWRTTGCQFGGKCHYRHIPENKGVDKKAWQRVK